LISPCSFPPSPRHNLWIFTKPCPHSFRGYIILL
jgi:hypothetical protein